MGESKHEAPPHLRSLEIIRLVEQSHLPARRTLKMPWYQAIDVHRWYDTDPAAGGAEDKLSKPDRVWNRIPDDVRQRVVMMAFEQPEHQLTRTGDQVHRHQQLLRLGIVGLSAIEGP